MNKINDLKRHKLEKLYTRLSSAEKSLLFYELKFFEDGFDFSYMDLVVFRDEDDGKILVGHRVAPFIDDNPLLLITPTEVINKTLDKDINTPVGGVFIMKNDISERILITSNEEKNLTSLLEKEVVIHFLDYKRIYDKETLDTYLS